jgi:SAM-dependent methyltransferase
MAADTMATDHANAKFWDELCGTHLANYLGITDSSERSLKKFDDWFFAFYPYVFLHIPFDEIRGKDVLEVGLGYGTVSQRLVESGAHFTGLDIATGPVEMARHRIKQTGLSACAQQGSILTAPFQDASFDLIVTIGCLHHTGDLAKAIDECWRMLRPCGKLMVMVYYAYSYRRWMQARSETLRYFCRERLGYVGVARPLSDSEKRDYDHNVGGEAAPHTDFVSVRSLRRMCSKFSSFEARLENMNVEPPFQNWASRRDLLKTLRARFCGLEIYATAIK